MRRVLLLAICYALILSAEAQHSVARQWNEVLLESIRNDFARPTVHARNLFHSSVIMWDVWATYDAEATPYFMGRSVAGYQCNWGSVAAVVDVEAARQEAMSYGLYGLLSHRFASSPEGPDAQQRFDSLMNVLGYDISITDTDYATGSPAAVGNYIAQCIINFGLQDGSNEANDYSNQQYFPINEPLIPFEAGNPELIDFNRWQPLTLDIFIDQSGNPIAINTPPFLSAEWGEVVPFAMTAADRTTHMRDGEDLEWTVYQDPGPPVYLNIANAGGNSDLYRWGFEMVAIWSSHLDPTDGVVWDISPGAQGNQEWLPTDPEDYESFYNFFEGGDISTGHSINPTTGLPYEPQMVPRGDYTRVLAEFWADGPDSETPPGHWFTILNYVSDHPLLEKRFKGQGAILSDLEWDVKAYFTLGGAMHDAAIAAWSIKGYYDYIRPISAIRGLGELGQSSQPLESNYSAAGIRLWPGYIEQVVPRDEIAGNGTQHLGKVKLYGWRGPGFISDPETDQAGVGWILAENWWPYQRPSFVTPNFAGYVSGHSTYSRAAAEVLTLLTGDPFFPGGMGEFEVKANEFLVFEEGPSVDFTLQWATYQDASDQTSLSRIWGGIHPPVDDIPGRLIGEVLGPKAFNKAEQFFEGLVTNVPGEQLDLGFRFYPNPLQGSVLNLEWNVQTKPEFISILNANGAVLQSLSVPLTARTGMQLPLETLEPGLYLVHCSGTQNRTLKLLVR